ncbi:MAG TPA: hypothetical protein VF193_00220 [Steroidobacter sp.]
MILLRPARDAVEVLVTRRHENMKFMGGLWVFPGGTLSPADSSAAALACLPEAWRAHCPRFTDLHGERLEPDRCAALAVTAYRETFEETGVLLARTRDGQRVSHEARAALLAQRRAVAAQPELFAPLLSEHGMLLDTSRLLYWAHWITPSGAPRRFDTRFFLAPVPPEETAEIDAIEATDHAWKTPAALIREAREGSMPLSPPTLYNLIALEAALHEHGSLSAMLEGESDREISPVMPKMLRGETTTTMVLPWDPEYARLPGENVPEQVRYPSSLTELPSRVTLRTSAL